MPGEQNVIADNYYAMTGGTTRVVTSDVAASGVRQRFTYYTSNLDVFINMLPRQRELAALCHLPPTPIIPPPPHHYHHHPTHFTYILG